MRPNHIYPPIIVMTFNFFMLWRFYEYKTIWFDYEGASFHAVSFIRMPSDYSALEKKNGEIQKGNKRNNNMIWLWGPLCSVNRQYKESQQRPTLDYCTPLRLSTWKSPWKMHVIRSTKSKLFHIFYHFMMIVCFSDCQCNNFLGGKHKADTSCLSLVLFCCF